MNKLPMAEVHRRISAAVESQVTLVSDIATSLYNRPELGLQETYASDKLAGTLERQDWTVQRGQAGLPTAFVARVGRGRPCLAFMAEYDALPGVGHGCGHNLIAGAAVAAAAACRAVMPPEEHGVSWVVAGTPAEESYGGKIAMVDAGVFAGMDAAFLAHPGMRNGTGGASWASHPIELTFHGLSAHAGGNPQGGVNALDACVQAYIMIRNLRNQVRDDVRLAGVITHGGDVQNVIPDLARLRFTVRSREWRFIEETLIPRIIGCAQAAAAANLGSVEWRHHELLFKECLEHPVLQALAAEGFARWGEVVPPPPPGAGGGTTDVGAVTWVCPTIQISYRITDARGHSREMADATVTGYAIRQTLVAAKILAGIAAELVFRPGLLAQARAEMQVRR